MTPQPHNALDYMLDEIMDLVPNLSYQNKNVSTVSVGWHLDHVLKVICKIIDALEQSEPKAYRYKLNFMRMSLFTLKYIPRGKGKAPKVVLPTEAITEEDLTKQLIEVRHGLEKAKHLPENCHFNHFIFGCLSKKRTLLFLKIHTRHHLKIIYDMLKTKKP